MLKNPFIISSPYGDFTCFIEYYEKKKLISIMCIDEDGFVEPYCTATSTVPNLQDGYVAIKNYSENTGILEKLIELGVIEKPKRHLMVNLAFGVCLDICRVVADKMAEYNNALA